MIKVKIKDPMVGKNSISFLGFVLLKDMVKMVTLFVMRQQLIKLKTN